MTSKPSKEQRRQKRMARLIKDSTSLSTPLLVQLVGQSGWKETAQSLVNSPDTSSEVVANLAEALSIISVKRRSKELAWNKERGQRELRQLQEEVDLELKIQDVRDRKAETSLDAWCLYLAENPDKRAFVGVRERPIKITIAENAVLKAKEGEVRSRRYVYRTTLIKQGWTPELIDSVLGAPDKFVVNPHYRYGPKAMLYWTNRVNAAGISNL